MGRKSLVPMRQKEMVKAFYKVAQKEGLENASIAKVAAYMEVNPSLVMHYFKTKQDLLHGLIEYITERYIKIYDPGDGVEDPEERLRIVIRNLFSRKWGKLFDDGVFYSGYALIFREEKIKSHYKALHDKLREQFAQALKEARDKKVIKVDDVNETADLIFVFVEGTYYYLSMVKEKAEYQTRLEHYEKMVLSYVGLK